MQAAVRGQVVLFSGFKVGRPSLATGGLAVKRGQRLGTHLSGKKRRSSSCISGGGYRGL